MATVKQLADIAYRAKLARDLDPASHVNPSDLSSDAEADLVKKRQVDHLVGEGFYVKCPGCGQVFHETTERFDSSVISNGTMFRLIETYGPRGANWSSFPSEEVLRFDALTCPGCGCSYTQGGAYVRVTPKNELDDVDAPGLDRQVHEEYKDMVDQGLFVPVEEKTTE